jgi:Fic family protein
MLYRTPDIPAHLAGRLAELDRLRARLGSHAGRPVRWMGTLRRRVRATSVAGSTSIEGFRVPQADAIALVSGTEPADPQDVDRQAVVCYSRAMDHVGVMALDGRFRWLDRVILDLHFETCYFQREKSPGRLREGPIAVTSETGGIAYAAPDADDIPALMDEMVDWLATGDLETHVVVRAAMAHLHLVSVHPFRDGSGRISRILQSLVLALEGVMTPEFASIEEYLGRNTSAYYAALQAVQGGRYQPERDALPWIEFCVQAHLEQATQRLAQIEQAAARWAYLERLAEDREWPERLVIALEQSLIGGADRASYVEEAEVSPATATNDFRRLLDAGLVDQRGRGRNIRYVASETLSQDVAAHDPEEDDSIRGTEPGRRAQPNLRQ